MSPQIQDQKPIRPIRSQSKDEKIKGEKIKGLNGNDVDEMEFENEMKLFAPDTDEEEDKEPWIPVENGEAAPVTPPMSPKRGSKTRDKGLSQGAVDHEALYQELFADVESKDAEESWKKWRGIFEDEEAEEGRRPRKAQVAHKVSKEEREEHELTHCGFRIWCKYCVEGRSHKMGHMQRRDVDSSLEAVPRISMDYFYMSQHDEKAKEYPLLVAVDESTGEKFARTTGRKGVEGCDWLIKELSEELSVWGHAGGNGGCIILKSDSESALKAFRDALAKYHGGKVIPEAPAKGESQSNGAAEAAGKLVREFIRVLKQQLEDKAKMKLKGDEDVVQWMARWAAMLVSRYLVGKDGRTGYERRKGRQCRLVYIPFGELVWYREVRKKKQRENKLETEMKEGIFSLFHRSSSLFLLTS